MCCSSVSYAAVNDSFGYYQYDNIQPLKVSLLSVEEPVMIRSTGKPTISLTGSVNYGNDPMSYLTVSSQLASFSDSSNGVYAVGMFGSYTFPGHDGVYLNHNGVYFDSIQSLSASYPDIKSVDFYGSISSRLFCASSSGGSSYQVVQSATSYDLLVNGEVVYSTTNPNVSFSYELGVGDEISSVGYRAHFPSVTLQKDYGSVPTQARFLFVRMNLLEVNNMQSESGWFNALFEWLSNILGGIQNIGFAIADLPGQILSGIQSLFIPSAEDLEEINTRWQTMLETKLGFVWQAGSELVTIANAVIDEMEGGTPYAFVFPGISFPQNGEELVILPETEVSLENDFMDVVRPVLCSVTIAVSVIAFINTAESMLAAIVSGASYYQFLHRKE